MPYPSKNTGLERRSRSRSQSQRQSRKNKSSKKNSSFRTTRKLKELELLVSNTDPNVLKNIYGIKNVSTRSRYSNILKPIQEKKVSTIDKIKVAADQFSKDKEEAKKKREQMEEIIAQEKEQIVPYSLGNIKIRRPHKRGQLPKIRNKYT